MGQYHKTVSMDAGQFLTCYDLGSGAKAWEQVVGGVPAALAALIARRPGNMPGDLNDPMLGAWAGHRLLVVGDYSEKRDIRGFKGAPLDQLYGLCADVPQPEDFSDLSYTRSGMNKRTGAYESKRVFESAEQQYTKAVKEFARLTRKHAALANIAPTLRGLLEEALSVRFCGSGSRSDRWVIPVEPYAVKGDDHAHYMLPKGIDQRERDFYFRVCGIPEGTRYPDTLPGGRWPWDRAPLNRAQHSLTTAQMDEGQHRVFVNLDRREYVDPAALGEIPTTAGIMRAAAGVATTPRMAMDMVIAGDSVQTDVKEGASEESMGSASGVWAMLLHPETRGGGDIERDSFPELGRWRDNRILLTAEVEPTGEYPTTEEARASFKDITGKVGMALAKLSRD